MDKIYIKNFEIFANHGVFNEEKNLGQKFILDLEASLSLEEAGKTGNLKKSVHYGELCLGIEKVFTEKSYDLIETAAERVAEFTLITYPAIKSVKVKLKKPWAPIGRHVEYAAVEVDRGWHEAYLSIGSNIGDKENNLHKAIDMIKEDTNIEVIEVSSFIVTEPWGKLDQDEFVNGAVKIRTILSPKYLLDRLLDIEEKMHRVREVKWGPRIIDLDIIFYDDLVLEDDYVTIPHPRMEEREFVLKPLNEIAPNKIHPLLNKRVFKILEELK
ncbi:2-amino-4-hydroxy-6-hydroxymethyldihydropteridine diphosphokinase [Clostridium sp. SHJSY1]|uniref:2-amino-4-hydroxy-6- hydroxymethyldihydropteridine diphosphokinase n=1 Tax=Clostridium sp. SHJSY1 TaxID=2942483 RepID=UPI00287632F8|nr:2-amino-4-hydroxy-6-hydroxymethyldihydropteridine diphosphokinase [Clostridium sp. SHJSY1]MDS0525735.1 2-amino-4-hydroxy-6-hydroxymethyldihydropteridine diphosphokinase [Clostridium sp. SHJSY1]